MKQYSYQFKRLMVFIKDKNLYDLTFIGFLKARKIKIYE
jgi:hypothetical protein